MEDRPEQGLGIDVLDGAPDADGTQGPGGDVDVQGARAPEGLELEPPEHHPVAAPRELAAEAVDGIAVEGTLLAFHPSVDAKAGAVHGDRPLPAGRALDAEARTHHVLLEHVEVHGSVEGELAEGPAAEPDLAPPVEIGAARAEMAGLRGHHRPFDLEVHLGADGQGRARCRSGACPGRRRGCPGGRAGRGPRDGPGNRAGPDPGEPARARGRARPSG